MGRIRLNIDIAGKKHWTLFDTGARNSYIIKKNTKGLPSQDLAKPNLVSLGGKVHQIKQGCLLNCNILGYPIQTHFLIIDNIGIDEDKKKIEVIIGALAMQQWGIVPVPVKETLDMSRYPKEFVEF